MDIVNGTDITRLNQVNMSNAVRPNYTPRRMDQKIELYISLDEKVLIAGSADNNYIFQTMYHTCFNRTHEPNMEWETPFGYYYGTDQIKNNGTFFANALASFPDKLKKQCEAREAGGRYIHVLQRYWEMLNERTDDVVADYYAAKPVIDIIQEEKYLILSQDIAVRNLYHALCSRCSSLYNAYMTEVR